MPNCDGGVSDLDESPRSERRGFLKRLALLTVGASVASAPSMMSLAGAHEAEKKVPESCRDINIPMRDVEGRVAFITGGSSGIGLGIARAFAEAGMKIAVSYRTQKHMDEAMKELKHAKDRVHAIALDVTDPSAMKKAAAEVLRVFGKVHVLVNNAGVVHTGPLSQTSYEDWAWVMNVNVNGVFNGVRAFLPYILDHGEGGQIVTTASMDGLVAHRWHNLSYTTSKFAVVGMMEALRATLADEGVGVSVYCPGGVKSRIDDSARNRPGNPTTASSQMTRTDSEIFMDPYVAGQLVLRGMRSNDLYILTHPEYEQIVRDRNEALVTSFPKDLSPTNKQVELLRPWRESSIYVLERTRAQCARWMRTRVLK